MKKLVPLFIIFPISILAQPNETTYSIAQLKQDQSTTEKLLVDMLQIERLDLVERLLPIYQGFENRDQRLVNFAQIKLAQPLFWHYRNNDTREKLQAVKNQQNLTKDEVEVIEQYFSALDKRERWQFSFGANYVHNKNVNNATQERNIENTGFIKNDDMMPKSAKGVAYFFSAEKNKNIAGSHYLYFLNDLSGKYYWNNRDYDEINNRTYLGYLYQNANFKWALKPFYERQWFNEHRHNWAKGVRMEWQKPFAKQWQISTAFEFNQPRYFTQAEKNGTIKLASATLVWFPSEKGYLYLGADFIREKTRVRQYSNDLKSLRLGWTQQWQYGITSQLNGSVALRQFKDLASIGGILPLGKIRQDNIYTANLTLWKKDWHWWGLTPKVQLKYKRQKSNIPSMYSYKARSVQMLLEKDL